MSPDEKEMQGQKIYLMKVAMTAGIFFAGMVAALLIHISSVLEQTLNLLKIK